MPHSQDPTGSGLMAERQPLMDEERSPSGSKLARAKVARGDAAIRCSSTGKAAADTLAGLSPDKLTSCSALPDFVSIVPVRLPFPALPPRPPKRALSREDSLSSRSSESPRPAASSLGGSPAISRALQSPAAKTKRVQLSCETWLQSPESRRLFTGAQALACRIAEAYSWSNRQHAVLELDIMLHDNVNMPEMVNVSSIFAGMLRAGLPALAQHLITLMDQPEENPMVAGAAFAVLDALVEWMSGQLVAKLGAGAAAAAARADIVAVLRSLAEELGPHRQRALVDPSSVKAGPMAFEHTDREAGPVMRALLWLAKSPKSAHRVCFASLVSSVAQAARRPMLRAFHAEALVRPLLRMARYSNSTMQSAAFLALGNLMSYPAAQQCLCEDGKHLRILTDILENRKSPLSLKEAVCTILRAGAQAEAVSMSTLTQAGAIHGLVSVLKDLQATLRALAHATFVLKRLTATKYISRASFVVCEGPQALMSILLRKAKHAPSAAERATDKGKGLVHCDAELAEQASALAPTGMDHLAQAQYNAARIIRHLALDKDAAHRMAAHAAVPTLVSLMRGSCANVKSASAAAISAAVEGSPRTAEAVNQAGGLDLLISVMKKGSPRCKTTAVEALQATAAESASMRSDAVAAGAVPLLANVLKDGDVTQQAASMGALQSLAMAHMGSKVLQQAWGFADVIPRLCTLVKSARLPLRSLAAGALSNFALGSPEGTGAMLSNDIIPVVVELLKCAQVDGQYAATALLYNMAASSRDARVMLGLCRGTQPLIRLLCHDSWYCRIVAADLLALLAMDAEQAGDILALGALPLLAALLNLRHSPGMLETVKGPVMGLTYEKGDSEIFMSGYKFAAAKLTSCSALGCLAKYVDEPEELGKEVMESMVEVLLSRNIRAQQIAAAAIADICVAAPRLQDTFLQMSNERGAADIQNCMQHKGAATLNLINVDINSKRHIGYAIIAKCSASAQAIAGLTKV